MDAISIYHVHMWARYMQIHPTVSPLVNGLNHLAGVTMTTVCGPVLSRVSSPLSWDSTSVHLLLEDRINTVALSIQCLSVKSREPLTSYNCSNFQHIEYVFI